MTGIYEHSLDAKGRLSVPAKIKEELGETFYVTLAMDRCLKAYPMKGWEKFMEKVEAMSTAHVPPGATSTGRAACGCRRNSGNLLVWRRT